MSLPPFRLHIASSLAIALASLAAPTLAQTVAPATDSSAAHAAVLDDAILGEQRGGQAIVIGNQTLQSALTGNTIAGSYVAGAISLSDNAFANFNGMGNVVINSGAQANLQSAMNLTVNLGN